MAHCLQAFVAPAHVSVRLDRATIAACIVTLPQNVVLVPLVRSRAGVRDDARVQVVEPFFALDQHTLDAFLTLAGDSAIGYFETEYFGGTGTQSSALWHAGRVVIAPHEDEGAVNRMLAALGVQRSASQDEFDTVGLGLFRSMDDFAFRAR